MRLWILMSALATSIAGATPPAEMLRKIDQAINPYEDRRFTVRMSIREADGSNRVAEIRIAERGRGKQRIMMFTAPADVKGMGVLAQDRNTLYVYLPSYHRVRRVAMHARKQTFLGSDFTFDDMAQITFSEDYDANLLTDEGAKVTLTLTPKAGRESQYSRIVTVVDRATWLIEKLQYFDAEGKHVKTETRWDYRPLNGVPMQTRTKMVDERTGHTTEIEVVEVQVNLGLPQRLFTKRGLIRGKL